MSILFFNPYSTEFFLIFMINMNYSLHYNIYSSYYVSNIYFQNKPGNFQKKPWCAEEFQFHRHQSKPSLDASTVDVCEVVEYREKQQIDGLDFSTLGFWHCSSVAYTIWLSWCLPTASSKQQLKSQNLSVSPNNCGCGFWKLLACFDNKMWLTQYKFFGKAQRIIHIYHKN